VPELLGAGRAFLVHTEAELDEALDAAARHTESYMLLDVHLDPLDKSAALGRLAERMSKRI
jgi:indolepyruvate decarboxylase